MKLVLYNDYQLGVIQNGNVVDAMAAAGGHDLPPPPRPDRRGHNQLGRYSAKD